MFYNHVIADRKNLIAQIDLLQKQIRQLPQGELLCVRNGHYVKWFKSNGKNPIYIPKKERGLAEALALKKFYELQLDDLNKQLHLSTSYLEYCQKGSKSAMSLLDDTSCYRELLEPYLHSFADKLQQWADSDYEHNTIHPEYLIHKTLAGYKVRSKSEVIIANTLFINKIPVRYECALKLQNICFYPDFTIRHPKSGKTIYWEHFGMMDQPTYYEKAFNKLRIYASQGIIPSINLITTYETQTHPVNSEKIQQIVHEEFLYHS